MQRGELNSLQYVKSYQAHVSAFSVGILLVPTLLLYLNRSIKYAMLSAIAQIVTKRMGKIYVAYVTKVTFHTYLRSIEGEQKITLLAKAKVGAIMMTQEAGINNDLNDVGLI